MQNMSIYDKRYDVVVIGGGVSGSAAAISAARAGANTLVIEESGFMGGTLTTCGVAPMMTFFSGEKQVIKGVMQEIVDRLMEIGCSCGHVKDTTRYVSYITPFEAEGLKLVLDELLTGAGCAILFHTFAVAVDTQNGKITSVTVGNKDGLHKISAKVYIDATGDGDIMAWAGAEYTVGRPNDGATQPMTTKMKYTNVDTKLLKHYIKDHLDEFPRLINNLDLLESDCPLSVAGFEMPFKQAKRDGEIHIPREDVLFFETARPGEFVVNTTRVVNRSSTDATSFSLAEIEGRKQCAELDHFLRKYVPGFKNSLLEFTGPSIGVRESRQLIGKYILSADDILEARKFPSRIAHSGYPIDIHNPKGEGTCTHQVGEKSDRKYYDIPYEIMLPKNISNLLVAGRCVSADFEAQASVRLSPSAGAIGQAAGVAAALSVRDTVPVAEINIVKLQNHLRMDGAYIDEE